MRVKKDAGQIVLVLDDPLEVDTVAAAANRKLSSRHVLHRRRGEWKLATTALAHGTHERSRALVLEGADAELAINCVLWVVREQEHGRAGFLPRTLAGMPRKLADQLQTENVLPSKNGPTG
jgi:hypothetical protein